VREGHADARTLARARARRVAWQASLHEFGSERNLFVRPDGGDGLSELGRHFLGGVMAHLDAIVAVACPTVNSYKRMLWQPPAPSASSAAPSGGFSWAPVYASHGANNRTNAIRVPASGRFEIRASDAALNPHLAAALTLAAGLEGIERRLEPGPSRGHENLYERAAMDTAAMDTAGVRLLPRNLGEAVDAFEADPLTKAVFGESMHAAWVSFKRAEWREYCTHVSDWELARYLRQFG
jgi:glutamine synthetase